MLSKVNTNIIKLSILVVIYTILIKNSFEYANINVEKHL